MNQLACACGNTTNWRNLTVTDVGVTATCGICGANVSVPASTGTDHGRSVPTFPGGE